MLSDGTPRHTLRQHQSEANSEEKENIIEYIISLSGNRNHNLSRLESHASAPAPRRALTLIKILRYEPATFKPATTEPYQPPDDSHTKK